MDWFRWHHGTVTDPKWRVVAAESGQPLAVVLAVWAAMLEHASQNESRGTLAGWRDKVVAAALDLAPETVQAIREAMEGMTLDGDDLPGWKRRQPKREDDSSDRVRAHRSRVREEVKRTVTPRNTRGEESREEKNRSEKSQPAVRAEAPERAPDPPAPEPDIAAATAAGDGGWKVHRDECTAFVVGRGYGRSEQLLAAGEDKAAWQDPKTGSPVPWPDRLPLLRLADARVQDGKSPTLRSALNYVRPQQLDPAKAPTSAEFASSRPVPGTEHDRVRSSYRSETPGAARHLHAASAVPERVLVNIRAAAAEKLGPDAPPAELEREVEERAVAWEKHHGTGARGAA